MGDEGSVTLVLRDDQPIEGKINRTANLNGTARIIGGVVLRDWFRRTYSEGDRVEVRFETPRCFSPGLTHSLATKPNGAGIPSGEASS